MNRARISGASARSCDTLGALPLPSWGEGVTGQTDRPKPLTPPLSQPKSDLSDFGHHNVPNSGKPEFGWEKEQTESVARPVTRSPFLALLAFFALLLFIALPALALDFPALTGRVVDEAGILDAATRTALTDKLAALEAKSTDQLVVVTLKSLQGTSLEDFGYQLGRRWQSGQKDKNNGVLLIGGPSG